MDRLKASNNRVPQFGNKIRNRILHITFSEREYEHNVEEIKVVFYILQYW